MDCHFTRDIWNCYEFLDMCIFMVVYKIQSLLEILHARDNLFQINRNEKIHTFLNFYSKSYHSLLEFTWDTSTGLCLTPPLPFFILEKYYDPIEFATESNYLCFFQSKVQRNWFWLKIIYWGLGGGHSWRSSLQVRMLNSRQNQGKHFRCDLYKNPM